MNWFHIFHDPATATAHVILRDDIGTYGRTPDDLRRELAACQPRAVELIIDSPGGDAIAGLKLHDTFKGYETRVLISGLCCSAAVLVAMAGKRIQMHPDSRVMLHSPATFVFGASDELLNAAIQVERLRSSYTEILGDRTGQPLTTVEGWLARDTWFTAAEALAAGLVDEITPLPASAAPAAAVREAGQPQATDQEKLFHTWLAAFGPMRVANRETFGRHLATWFASVRE